MLVRLAYSADDVSIVLSKLVRAADCASASVLSLLTSDTKDDVVVAVAVGTKVQASVVVGAGVCAVVVVGAGVPAAVVVGAEVPAAVVVGA